MNQTLLLLVSYIIISLISIAAYSGMINITENIASDISEISDSDILLDESKSSTEYKNNIKGLRGLKYQLMSMTLSSALILGLNFSCIIFICVYFIMSRFSSISVKVESNLANVYTSPYKPSSYNYLTNIT